MTIIEFPPISEADETGLLAVGGDLEVDSLLLAYQSGIFPWPHSPRQLLWFAPPERAVLYFEKLHISRSLARAIKQTEWRFTFDKDFRKVIEGCASSGNRKKGTVSWIYPQMVEAYCALHEAGHAHSIECYEQDDLVGGLYGVSIGKLFCAESMFYLRPNASKICLVKLVEHLRQQGLNWLDCQVINPFTAKMGAEEIPREQYMQMLSKAAKARQALQF